MDLAETIKQLNETGGQEAPAAPPTPTPTPEPAKAPAAQAPTPAAVPAATPTTETKPAAVPQGTTTIPKDPSFVKQPKGAAPAATPGSEPAKTAAETPAATPPENKPDEVFTSRLSELSGGAVKSEQDLSRILTEHRQLVDQARKGFQPQFKDERAKWVHQVITENPDKEPEALMRVLRAASFKPEGKTPKDVLFEAYLLDPNNSDLSPLTAQEYFEAEYDEKYRDVDTNLIAKRKLEVDTKLANEQIQKIQSEFKATDEVPQQISREVESAVAEAIDTFGGVSLSFSDNPQENELLNVALDDPQELQAIREEILNPNEAYNEFLSQFDFKSPQGWQDLTRELYERRNHKEIRQRAFEHGRALERISMAKELRNSSEPGRIENTGNAPAGTQKGFFETWAEAEQRKAG